MGGTQGDGGMLQAAEQTPKPFDLGYGSRELSFPYGFQHCFFGSVFSHCADSSLLEQYILHHCMLEVCNLPLDLIEGYTLP